MSCWTERCTLVFVPYEEIANNEKILERAYVSKWNGRRGVIRQLVVGECLRLMGFPDTFKIVVSTQQMLKQAGNSIVVDVMMAVLKSILNTGVFEEVI